MSEHQRSHVGIVLLRKGGLALTLVSAIVLSACSGGGGAAAPNASAGGGCEPAAAGEVVHLTFTSWIPDFQQVVDLWNSENPNIQVDYTEVPEGSSGTYQNYLNQIKSGQTDDLGFIGYETLPTFLVQGGLKNFYDCPGVADAKAQFLDSVWNLTSLGEANTTYALGLDYGPDALYYRKDLFDAAGISVPTTWDEFLAAAQTIKQDNGHIMNIDASGCPTFWPTLFQQSGAHWFSRNDNSWNVNLAGDDSKRAADYIQGLVDEELVTTYPCFQDEFTKAYNTGEIWATLGGPWMTSLLASVAPDTSGNWQVAPIPQWEAGENRVPAWGGAAMAMFSGSAHPYEASQFAIWATTSPEALALDNVNGGLYPPIRDVVSKVDVMQEGVAFYGNQKVWEVFDEAANNVTTDWTWGPTMTQVNADLSNEMAKAFAGDQTVFEALKAIQQKTLDAMAAEGIQTSQ